jgi:deoxyribodipyrimidine photo-lyase
MSTLVWFRRDLRIADNPALAAARAAGGAIIPVYIHTPGEQGEWTAGAASRWWLHHSLASLREDLRRCGSQLCVRASPDCSSALQALVRECGASRVVWNRRYEPAEVARDRDLKARLRADGLHVDSYNSSLLHEPWTVRTKSDRPFQVFTPFWRHCKSLEEPLEPLPAPTSLPAPAAWPASHELESLELLPKRNWSDGLESAWTPGSSAAHARLERFLTEAFGAYEGLRDLPALRGTSRLSPHLHFGEIGPRQIWHATRLFAQGHGRHTSWRDSQFLTELGWREFAYHLLFHFPSTPGAPLRANFTDFPWKSDPAAVAAWQRGATGYPIVDAGMRELWQTGWMHNRVRMIAASFLVKDLLVPWLTGARWFWDTLVDADLASNTLGWQWVAGCGADAAPFFRIFNPVSQGMRFDPEGGYVRRWVPELEALPNKYLHQPWEAPPEVRRASRVALGENYPERLIDHDVARRRALAAFAALKR